MKDAFELLAKEIITIEDLYFVIEQINIAKKYLFVDVTKGSLFERIKGKIDEGIRLKLKEIVPPSELIEKPIFFEELKKYLHSLPQIKLELAFVPSKKFLIKVKKWLKETTGQEIVLDIIVNPEIVGGANIEYQGKYLDCSLAKNLKLWNSSGNIYSKPVK